MRKWRGNRPRRGREQDSPSGSPEPAPVEAADAAGSSEPEEAAENLEAADAAVAEDADRAASATAKSRNRGRRRKKKPVAAEKVAAPVPLMPAYTETEGPRAPSPVAVVPGAPTGEAGELEVPVPPAPKPVPEAPEAAPAPASVSKRPAKGAVVLSVGLPGSGKTTWFRRKGVTPLSSDLLRALLFDDPTQQGHQDLVFSSLRYLLRARLMARMPMNYVDATNLSPKERRHWVRLAREFGYEMHAVYFDVPLDTCLERNQKRQRVVPEEVMQRMAAKLRPPTFEEGFAKIIVVRVKHRPAGSQPAAVPGAPAAAAEEEAEVTPGRSDWGEPLNPEAPQTDDFDAPEPAEEEGKE